MLEAKCAQITDQFERQREVHLSAESRTKRVEADYFEIKERLRRMEEDISSTEVIREALRIDKEKV